ncbi:hypothetical protein DU000_10350 [Parvibium lacunae]|uniref:DUF3592 domain-containing protein n=1 Tax=Parvibium lacunae TaxID=1888893 RepID=A0A368KZK9_9BURK|nr:hypothetical protein DU000_10350 [Parvibium lacunae]
MQNISILLLFILGLYIVNHAFQLRKRTLDTLAFVRVDGQLVNFEIICADPRFAYYNPKKPNRNTTIKVLYKYSYHKVDFFGTNVYRNGVEHLLPRVSPSEFQSLISKTGLNVYIDPFNPNDSVLFVGWAPILRIQFFSILFFGAALMIIAAFLTYI